jgi:holo-[acyl-carrier protein] synthase
MIGIGIDLVDIARFRQVIARRPGIVARVFCDAEQATVAARIDPAPGLAARFAAKEAAMKALGVGIGAVDFRELEVVSASSGAPSMVLSGRAAERAEALGVTSVLVSLSHTDDCAGAIVFAE